MDIPVCQICHFHDSTVRPILSVLPVLRDFTPLICSFHRGLEMGIRFQYNVSTQRLRTWYCSQVLAAALSVSALETVLMLRGKQSLVKASALVTSHQSMPFI